MMPTSKPNRGQAFLERNLMTAQLLLAIAAAALLAGASLTPPFDAWVQRVVNDDRRDLYTTLTSVAGALLGFVMAAAAIILAAIDSPRLDRLRSSSQYRTLWSVFVSTSKWLGLLTISGLAGILIDRKDDPRVWLFYGIFGLSVLCVLRFATCVWILESVTTALSRDLGPPAEVKDPARL